MTDDVLRVLLQSLGVDARTWKVVTMLPLVQVAWADGAVQDAERRRVLEIAVGCSAVEGDGRMVLEGWLRHRPSESYFARGSQALCGLASRGGLRDCGMDERELLARCEQVAVAASGFFGVLGGVDADERAAIAAVKRLLSANEAVPLGPTESAAPGELAPFVGEDEITENNLAPVGLDACSESDAVPAPRLVFANRAELPPIRLVNPTTIGRRGDCTVSRPDDPGLSRRHCHLHTHDGRWYLVDVGSTQGTTVNDERILERRLFGGEVVCAGALRFVVELEAS
jgi:hypothetical protein